MNFPMLADFALRLAGGMAALLLMTPRRVVPPTFFRTHCQVILGLLALAWLDLAREGPGRGMDTVAAGAVAVAYLATVCWGLGLVRFALPLTAVVVATAGALLVWAAREASPGLWALNGAGRLASAFLMGSTLTAMLLGHHYLTAPAMSIDPLRRFVRCMAWGLGARTALAAAGLATWSAGGVGTGPGGGASTLFLAVRWGMGLAGPALATYLAWETVRIRSTQSATGILYIAMTLVLFGELSALVLSRGVGVIF